MQSLGIELRELTFEYLFHDKRDDAWPFLLMRKSSSPIALLSV